MASSPETAPSGGGDDDGTVVSPPAPPAESPPTVESPPPPVPQSPPPSTTPASPPPSPPSPPPPDSQASPPDPSTSPTLSPPPDNPTPPSPPSSSKSPPSDSTPVPVFSPPPPKSGGSRTPPSAALSPPSAQSGLPPPPSSSDSNVQVAIVAGIISGAIVILTLIIIGLICSQRKKKSQYYMDQGYPPKGGDKYQSSSKRYSTPPKDHIVNLPPPPGYMGTPVGGWGVPSPRTPPPIVHNTNEFNSGYAGHYPMAMQPPAPNMGGYGAKSQFTYEELAAATGGFSQANLLGQGGFGLVHKGIFPNGKEVAVKSLKSGSGQGEREFQAEVEIISRVHHRHLVSLVGYCIAGDKRLLVYEFVPNKTLEFHLHGKDQPPMDWSARLRIAVGAAKGLAYLHEDCQPRIIHRDIKAANILMDFNFEAMVADFGLAKLTSDNYTHISTRVMGTFGYLAPEYAASGKLTEKSDVFSFGIMLLELITGKRPFDPTNITMEDSLVDWARPLLSKALDDGDYSELVDPRLGDNYGPNEMARMIACAAASIRHSARRRPRMSQIVRALDGNSSLDDLNEGVKPGQSASYGTPSRSRDVYDTCAYNADIMKFRQMVMTTSDSTEYGGTSEYGLNPSVSSCDSKEMDQHQKL